VIISKASSFAHLSHLHKTFSHGLFQAGSEERERERESVVAFILHQVRSLNILYLVWGRQGVWFYGRLSAVSLQLVLVVAREKIKLECGWFFLVAGWTGVATFCLFTCLAHVNGILDSNQLTCGSHLHTIPSFSHHSHRWPKPLTHIRLSIFPEEEGRKEGGKGHGKV
jgi:hypothetical protein